MHKKIVCFQITGFANELSGPVLLNQVTMKSKCFRQSLCKTNNGEVSISNCGQTFKVEYNNVIVIHPQSSFFSFYESVRDCEINLRQREDRNTRDVLFSTFSSCMILSFSPREIQELFYLLESSILAIKAHS